ncbi:nuclear transport factor 2 family protein [Halorussus salilacus]|uniref:nuclear transport factor 2 family protein n=1 Tax=Halorussus salilacus TaxID=2953750 RepID=UPI00209CA07E|nr:nuclear transport factor 2 family protein [Halorussus salilacus]USZ67134.1 nuclear transport factor 2 family protein [Halorussus salilacus]
MSEATALAYYDAIDAGDYEGFADLLAPGVVHDRPDRTIEGRETLVEFMRDGRPNTGTSHEVREVFGDGAVSTDGDTDDESDRAAGPETGGAVAVEGRLFDSDGSELFGFVDAFAFEDGKIAEIRTYTR